MCDFVFISIPETILKIIWQELQNALYIADLPNDG